jgi:hypothetical protein
MRKIKLLLRSAVNYCICQMDGKALFIGLVLCAVLAACNNSGSKENPAKSSSPEKSSSASNTGGTGSGSGCGRLIFFTPGAEVDTRTYNATGEQVGSQHTRIANVRDEGGVTVAYAEGTDLQRQSDTPHVVKYSYKCDGTRIYFDLASLFHSADKERTANFQSTDIEYPIAVKAGETLPDVTSTINMEARGRKVDVKMRFTDRKVEAKEDVTTPAGTWNCYRISHVTVTDMDIPGMSDKQKQIMQSIRDKTKMKTLTWLAPDFGIVKMEMYIGDRLVSRNEVISYKK